MDILTILEHRLNYYFSIEEFIIDTILKFPGYEFKEKVNVLGNLRILIFSNDHIPPHFHVISNDGKVDAKFKIENCELIEGKISASDLKRINAFYIDPKTNVKETMEKIWSKRL